MNGSSVYLAVLGLRCSVWASPGCSKREASLVLLGLLTAEAPLVAERGFGAFGFSIVAHGPRCPAACAAFQEQGLNRVPCIGKQVLNHQTTREVPFTVFGSNSEHQHLSVGDFVSIILYTFFS